MTKYLTKFICHKPGNIGTFYRTFLTKLNGGKETTFLNPTQTFKFEKKDLGPGFAYFLKNGITIEIPVDLIATLVKAFR